MTGCVHLGCCEDVCEGVVVGIHIEGQSIQVLREFFNH